MPGDVELQGQKLKGNQSSDKEASTAGPGGDVTEHELFSQNPLYSWLGPSAGWRWGLKEAGLSRRARTQTTALCADGCTMLTAGYTVTTA